MFPCIRCEFVFVQKCASKEIDVWSPDFFGNTWLVDVVEQLPN